jgi:hypothetical protein
MFDPIEKILGRKLVKRDWFSRNAMAPVMGGGGSSGGSSVPTTISHVDAQGHPYTISYSAPVHATPSTPVRTSTPVGHITAAAITPYMTSPPVRSAVPQIPTIPRMSQVGFVSPPRMSQVGSISRTISAPAPSISTPFVPQMYKVSPGAFTSRDTTKPYYGQVVVQSPSGRMGIDQGRAINPQNLSAADRNAFRESNAFRTYPSPTAPIVNVGTSKILEAVQMPSSTHQTINWIPPGTSAIVRATPQSTMGDVYMNIPDTRTGFAKRVPDIRAAEGVYGTQLIRTNVPIEQYKNLTAQQVFNKVNQEYAKKGIIVW